ncbi:hypothetical protein ACLM45_01495 [Synechococcus sp. A10-1-5-9]
MAPFCCSQPFTRGGGALHAFDLALLQPLEFLAGALGFAVMAVVVV